MKRFLLIALCVLSTLSFNSCATICCGTKKRVTFDSDVTSKGTLIVDGRRYREVVFPCKVSIKRGFSDSIVRFNFEGYESHELVVDKSFNPASILNLTNIVGWLVDLATGAITRPAQDFYWVDFATKSYMPEGDPVAVTPVAATPSEVVPALVVE